MVTALTSVVKFARAGCTPHSIAAIIPQPCTVVRACVSVHTKEMSDESVVSGAAGAGAGADGGEVFEFDRITAKVQPPVYAPDVEPIPAPSTEAMRGAQYDAVASGMRDFVEHYSVPDVGLMATVWYDFRDGNRPLMQQQMAHTSCCPTATF